MRVLSFENKNPSVKNVYLRRLKFLENSMQEEPHHLLRFARLQRHARDHAAHGIAGSETRDEPIDGHRDHEGHRVEQELAGEVAAQEASGWLVRWDGGPAPGSGQGRGEET